MSTLNTNYLGEITDIPIRHIAICYGASVIDRVAEVISEAFARSPKTQNQIANALGVSQASASRWLKGDNRPQPKHWPTIEKELNMAQGSIAQAAGYETERSPVEQRLDHLEKELAMLKQLLIDRLSE